MNLFEVYSFYSGCSCCIRVSSDSYSNSEVSKSNRTIQLDFISKFLMITDNLMHINLNQTRVKWMIQVKSLRNDSLNLSRVETIRPTGYTSLIQYSIIYNLLILSATAKKGYFVSENSFSRKYCYYANKRNYFPGSKRLLKFWFWHLFKM